MELTSILFFALVIVLAVSLFYKPLRIFIADMLFAVACGFGAFYQLFRVMSHDARNFNPKSGKVECDGAEQCLKPFAKADIAI